MTNILSSRVTKLEARMGAPAATGLLVDTVDGYLWDGRAYATPDELPFRLDQFEGTRVQIVNFARDKPCSACGEWQRAHLAVCPDCGSVQFEDVDHLRS